MTYNRNTPTKDRSILGGPFYLLPQTKNRQSWFFVLFIKIICFELF